MKISFQNLETDEIISEWELNPKQERFWKSEKKVILISGGFGAGKSLMLVLKAIDMALRYPDNFILMGRQTYVQLRDSLLKEFLLTCPEHLIESYHKAEMKIRMINGSEIIFRHLDKIAEQELRSLNLGCVFIDQAEDIAKGVFLALLGRLRRDGIQNEDRKLYMSINPELTWHYAEFKQNPKPGYDLIECSTYDNEKHLPEGYIKNLEDNYPEDFRKQYVEGIWDESLLSSNAVFEREYIEKLNKWVQKPKVVSEDLRVYKSYIKGHRYQMGIDVAEGAEEDTDKKDKSAITIVDLDELEEVAHWAGQCPPDVVADKAINFARMYQDGDFCTIVPEMNSIGLTLVNKLKMEDDIDIYRREEFDKSTGKRLKQLGWRTTRQSKPLLVSHFKQLLRLKVPKIRTEETVAEFKTFIHSNETRKSGMAAKTGFHDDRIMSTLLAFFEPGDVVPGKILKPKLMNNSNDVQPTIIIKNGKARLRGLQPKIYINKWTTH